MEADYLGLCYEEAPPYLEGCELSLPDVGEDGRVGELQLPAYFLDGEEALTVDLYRHGLPGRYRWAWLFFILREEVR